MGATGATGAAGPMGGQSTTTTASFTMPALNAAVTIAVAAAAWTKLGQTLYITDGTSAGWWEITTRTSTTSIAITNRGYVGTPASGTMATAAVVQLQGPGIATQAVPGFSPLLSAQTTCGSFVCPALGSTVTITTPSCTWTINGTCLWISDGTRLGFFLIDSRLSATSLSVRNISYVNALSSGTFSANSAVVFAGPGYAASGSPGIMPPFDAVYFATVSGIFTLTGTLPVHGSTHSPGAGDPLPIVVSSLGVVTTNQTVDCTGATSVVVNISMSTAAIGLTLSHLSPGVPVTVQVNNTSGSAARIFTMTTTNPASTTQAVFWKTNAGLVTMAGGSGISIPLGTTMVASGMATGGNQVMMVAN